MQLASYIRISTRDYIHSHVHIVKFHKFAVLYSYIMLQCLMLQSLDAMLDVQQLYTSNDTSNYFEAVTTSN